VHYTHAYDQRDRNRKLSDNKYGTKRGRACGARLSFQHRHRSKRRQKQGRVTARNHAHKDCQHQKAHCQRRILQEVEGQLLSDEIVEIRQRGLYQHDSHQQRQHGDKRGLPQKLPDEILPVRAQHFAQSDLAGAPGRAGGGEIHEIAAGDEQNEDRNCRKKIDVRDVAVGFDFCSKVRMQMDVGQLLQMQHRSFAGLI